MIGSDIRTFGSDRIWVSDRIRLNPYPIHIHSKKSDFIHIHIHYPVNGFFYCLTGSDRVGNPRIRTHLPSLCDNRSIKLVGTSWPAQFSYNLQRSLATGMSPFEVSIRSEPCTPLGVLVFEQHGCSVSPTVYKFAKS